LTGKVDKAGGFSLKVAKEEDKENAVNGISSAVKRSQQLKGAVGFKEVENTSPEKK
jgi:hypothetical protein